MSQWIPVRRPIHWPTLAFLWVAAAGYFLLGVTQGIESVDEGHLIYLSWRVSEGALPYRTFQHWYGPSVFFLNGLLFRLAGADLLVVRSAILVLRACLAVLVFVLADAAAGTVPALLAYLAAVVILGAPWWFFNTPYANNYQLPLTLAGLAVYLLAPGAPRARLLIAGLCLGLAATFKPTGGMLAFLGFVLFLFSRDDGAGRALRPVPSWIPWRALRVAVSVAALCVLGVFIASIGHPLEIALLVLPLVILALWSLAQGLHAERQDIVRNMLDAACLATAFALAPAAYAIWYATKGSVAALAWATVFGLPQRFALFVPFPLTDSRALPVLGFAVASLVGIRVCRATGPRASAPRRVGWVILTGILLSAIAASTGLLAPLRQGTWMGNVLRLLFWLPPVTVWATCLVVLRSRASELPEALAALAFVASALLPALVPVADWAHVLMLVPVFLPLAAYDLRAIWGSSEDGAPVAVTRRVCAAVIIAAWLAAVMAPFVGILWSARSSSTGSAVAFDRATFITDRHQNAPATHALVQYLQSRLGTDDRLLVLPSSAMIYFLTGRASALDDDEFEFYAATYGPQLSPRDARALVDQDDAVRRLEAERPLIVRVNDAPAERAFRQVFPTLSRYIDDRYRSVVAFGPYEVFESGPSDSPRPETRRNPAE